VSHILEIRGIKKHFPGVKALDWEADDVVRLGSGEIWGLVGENGAGKSTLIHILAGIYRHDCGQILLNGNPYSPRGFHEAQENGVAVILQEPGIIPSLTVGENLFIRRETVYSSFGIQNPHKRAKLAQELINDICPDMDVRTRAGDLTLEQQKLVELARALSADPKILIVDETSAAMTERNAQFLFEQIRQAKERGVLVILVSHRMEEIFDLCDQVLVLKDGKLVTTLSVEDTSPDELSSLMVGREIQFSGIRSRISHTDNRNVVLEVRQLSLPGSFENVSFVLREGEILGIGGLAGAGHEDILRVLFGDITSYLGDIILNGRKVRFLSPAQAISGGIGYAPKNRDKEGLILNHTIRGNIVLPIIRRLTETGFVKTRSEREVANRLVQDVGIKCQSANDQCISLSGGNRQKVVLSKWIASDSKLLLFDNPTRGVDVGAKAEIYRILDGLTKQGCSILMVSDDLPELIAVSDRILIFRRHALSAEFPGGQTTTEKDLITAMI